MVQVIPNTYAVLLLGRIMTGLGSGCVFISTSLYVAECAPRKLRGSFVGTVSLPLHNSIHFLTLV
jgi:MFS family permease